MQKVAVAKSRRKNSLFSPPFSPHYYAANVTSGRSAPAQRISTKTSGREGAQATGSAWRILRSNGRRSRLLGKVSR